MYRDVASGIVRHPDKKERYFRLQILHKWGCNVYAISFVYSKCNTFQAPWMMVVWSVICK